MYEYAAPSIAIRRVCLASCVLLASRFVSSGSGLFVSDEEKKEKYGKRRKKRKEKQQKRGNVLCFRLLDDFSLLVFFLLH